MDTLTLVAIGSVIYAVASGVGKTMDAFKALFRVIEFFQKRKLKSETPTSTEIQPKNRSKQAKRRKQRRE